MVSDNEQDSGRDLGVCLYCICCCVVVAPVWLDGLVLGAVPLSVNGRS